MKRCVFVLLVVFSTIVGRLMEAASLPAVPQIINPWFEDGLASWQFNIIVAPSEARVMDRDAAQGKRCLAILNGAGARGFVTSNPVEVKPSTGYQLSCRVRTENAPAEGVHARVIWYTREGPGMACASRHYDETVKVGGTVGWTNLSFATGSVVSPPDAAIARVRLETNYRKGEIAADTPGPFTVWFDDVALTPTGTGGGK